MNTTIKLTQLVDEKINELKSQIAAVKVNETLSKNTRGTQLYKLGRDRRVLHLIRSLLTRAGDDDGLVELSENDMNTFVLITTLAGERTERSSIEVNEGDSILELMQKYEEKKDLQKKLATACAKKGLKLDYASGTVVLLYCRSGTVVKE